MRCFNLTIKLSPARKSRRIVSNKFRSSLQRIESSKAFTKITYARFVSQIKRGLCSRFIAPSSNHFLHRHQNQPQKSFMAIFVDEFYEVQEEKNKGKEEACRVENKERIKVIRGETSSSHDSMKPSGTFTVEQKDLDEKNAKRKGKVGETSKYRSVDEAWNALIASSPQFRGVDERAEEFISKFKHDLKLQKEGSLLEFEEMLARGA